MIAVELIQADGTVRFCHECAAREIAVLLGESLFALTLPATGMRVILCKHHLDELSAAIGSAATRHEPRIVLDRTRIVGCTCGWQTPPGTTDSDGAFAAHVAIIRAGIGGGTL
jgi:hypothetical protein